MSFVNVSDVYDRIACSYNIVFNLVGPRIVIHRLEEQIVSSGI